MSIFVKSLAFGLMFAQSIIANAQEQTNNNTQQQSLDNIHFYSEEVAPYYWFNEDGTPQGFNVDLANALSKELMLNISVEELPWARAYQETISKPNQVLLSLLRVPKRENQFQWLGLVHHIDASFLGLNTRTDIVLESLEQAKQFRVGTIRGYGAAGFLQNRGFIEANNLVLISDTTRLWQLLYEGRIDLVVGDLAADRYEVASIGLNPDLIEAKLELPALSVELQVATGNLTSHAVVNKIKQTLITIKESGEFTLLLTKWGLK